MDVMRVLRIGFSTVAVVAGAAATIAFYNSLPRPQGGVTGITPGKPRTTNTTTSPAVASAHIITPPVITRHGHPTPAPMQQPAPAPLPAPPAPIPTDPPALVPVLPVLPSPIAVPVPAPEPDPIIPIDPPTLELQTPVVDIALTL